MAQDRMLPKVSWQKAAILVIVFTFFAGIMAWLAIRVGLSGLAAMPFILVVVGGWLYFNRRRCPQCYHRMTPEREMFGPTQYRVLYDCDRCGIRWDTGSTGDTRDDESVG